MEAVVSRVKSEFNEMPGLRLTISQAMRLWGMSRPQCEQVIDVLVREAFLKLTPSGDVLRVV
jgi:hypothetical protein